MIAFQVLISVCMNR